MSERPTPTAFAVAIASGIGLCQSANFMRYFATWSAEPNSTAMRAALLEHPASFSSSA
jgi:hypothetical protein